MTRPISTAPGYARSASSGGMVLRSALVARARAAERARLIVVHAPAGFGKSTLLRQIAADLESCGVPTAWMTLSPHDSDPSHFLKLLERIRFGKGVPDGAIRDSETTRPRTTATIAPRFLARLAALKGPAALFVDDFEHGASPAIVSVLEGIVRDLPEGKQIYLASRVLPDLPIARLLLNEQALVFGSTDLRFDLAETRDFLASHPEITLNDVRDIHSRTEGWPAALRFLALTLPHGRTMPRVAGGAGMTPELLDFLANDVFRAQSQATQAFLLDTCLADRVCGELAEHLCGCQDGAAWLDRICRAGLFLEPLDADRRWYRYHHVFREYLRQRLKAAVSAENLRARHTSIAEWCAAHDAPEEAIVHMMAAGNQAGAAQLLDASVERFVREERLDLIVRLAEQLDPEVLLESRSIQSAAVIAYGFRRLFAKAHRLLDWRRERLEAERGSDQDWGQYQGLRVFVLAAEDRVEEFGRAAAETLRLLDDRDPFTYAVALNAYSFWIGAQSRFHEAQDLLARARALHDTAGNLFGRSYQESIAASLLVSQGRLAEANIALRRAQLTSESESPIGAVGGAVIAAYLGDALYEANEIEEAERLLSAYLPLIEQQCIVDPLAATHATLARIALLRGQRSVANDVLQRSIYLGYQHRLNRLVMYGRAELARLATLEGDLSAAESELALMASLEGGEHPPAGLLFHAGELEAQGITRLRLLVYSGAGQEARAALMREIRTAEGKRRTRRVIRLKTLLAISLDLAGQGSAARRCLLEALSLGQGGGFARIFLDEGPRVLKLLREIADSRRPAEGGRAAEISRAADSLDEYLSALLDPTAAVAARSSVPAPPTGQAVAPSQTLTERERDLLRMMASGYSNQDLAERLSVSENTVKWHLKNIYDKLNTRNRLQAVNTARHLGLID